MKVIPLSEAKSKLSHYGRVCRKEPVVVTVNGLPAFELVALDENDDLIDQLISHNPRFRNLLRRRLKERSVPIKAALEKI
ncbi:MAG TPA: type II toxin-antitoxin system Phd/YefM family antitoxin [Gemmataceae bacterium]|jgi:prevent-host-death family protein|nr:type II toxin-antitoxin system Phd/YefM family antitoxin [Gemmataceae bacterium]